MSLHQSPTHTAFALQTIHGALPTPAKPLDWLCLAPHPDDAEIGAGGTLIRAADAGQRTGVLELTRGEMGTLGTPDVRAAECVAAAEILGLSWRGNWAYLMAAWPINLRRP